MTAGGTLGKRLVSPASGKGGDHDNMGRLIGTSRQYAFLTLARTRLARRRKLECLTDTPRDFALQRSRWHRH